MLTILHPEVMPVVSGYPAGLLALFLPDEPKPKLVVKASKECLLAAEMNNGFKIYVVPLSIAGATTIALITAFFDDADEPLIIRSPVYDDDDALERLLKCDALDVHMFDDNSRELLAFEAIMQRPIATQDLLERAGRLPFSYASARSAHDQMVEWFGLRSQEDDRLAISVDFGERLIPKDVFWMEQQPETHRYHGSHNVTSTQLVREEPGAFQERDIVQLLHRVFFPKEIFLNPLCVTDREEITDVLVVTDSSALFIQAKDSPNTERQLKNTLDRKKATAEKAITKAMAQVRGAIGYARSASPMKMLIKTDKAEINLEGKELRGLIVVKELFSDRYSEYTNLILPVSEEIRVPCIVLDYGDLVMYTAHLRNEDAFYEAFDRVYTFGAEHGEFPKLRLGLIEPS